MPPMTVTFRRLFLAIWNEQNRAWKHRSGRNKPSEKARETHDRLMAHPRFCNQFDQRALEARLPSADKLSSDFGHMFLLLPPTERASEFVSLMWARYDFSQQPETVEFRVTMSCVQDRGLKHLPFRMEYGTGMHSFYHAQIGNRNDRVLDPKWLPCRQPSFPLAANCPVTLTLALLLSLYGVKETGRVILVHKPLGIEGYKSKLNPWVSL